MANRFKIDATAPLHPDYTEAFLRDFRELIKSRMTNEDLWRVAYGIVADEYRKEIVGPEYHAKIAARLPGVMAWAHRTRKAMNAKR